MEIGSEDFGPLHLKVARMIQAYILNDEPISSSSTVDRPTEQAPEGLVQDDLGSEPDWGDP